MAKIKAINGSLIYEKEGAGNRETVISAIKSGCRLNYADLSGFYLVGVNFDGLSLRGINFRGSSLQTCSFVGAALMGADFSGAIANGANFKTADLSDARFVEANLYRASLEGANLTHANLSKANLWGAEVHRSIADCVDMTNANIYATKFDGTDLGTANFLGAVLDFSGETSKYNIQRYIEELNTKHIIASQYGWGVEAKGPGQPSKWNGEWETLFVCTERASRELSSTQGPETIEHTLTDRGQRYGSFQGHAAISQALQKVVADGFAKREDGKTIQDMTDAQREALFMVLHKVARIVNGDFNYDDSWRDIAGYAMLVVNELEGKE